MAKRLFYFLAVFAVAVSPILYSQNPVGLDSATGSGDLAGTGATQVEQGTPSGCSETSLDPYTQCGPADRSEVPQQRSPYGYSGNGLYSPSL
ncbi:MAG TPA: hypothetical protein VMI06_20035, partial [Terriglobia bacterium]|nr:hypothetical protein [Terriglobia bacterium]